MTKTAGAGKAISADDLYLFRQGTHHELFDRLGAHPARVDGAPGTRFSVWAPSARSISVVGSFNGWDPERHPLEEIEDSGIFSGFAAGAGPGNLYKFHLVSKIRGHTVDKADPFAFKAETPPRTASVICDLEYGWNDADWIARRGEHSDAGAPMSIYELHLGSWKRREDAPDRLPTYRELADELVEYLTDMNFTHIELLPVLEHPFYGSWGYQTTSYFAPTSRYGEPQDLMHLIDRLHQAGIGVILDWVPSHFPGDDHGLALFDGTRLFEYPDPRVGYQPDWKSYVFNFGRPEVQSFLISSANFWIGNYHIDAIRVDAVASMLYLDYSRNEGEWLQNKYGGRENLEAIELLRKLNDSIHARHEGVKMIAEESTAWPMVTKPPHLGGLGFDMKWDMGWMHDTLNYMSLDPINRKFNHGAITFRMVYAFSENFVLPLSHDEVVHGKGSLIGKMSGDEWQHFANLRLLYGYMYGQPGKKLLFMGAEFGQWSEWNHDRGLEWPVLEYRFHRGMQSWVRDLNRLYRDEPALHRRDFDPEGFRWIDCSDAEQSVVAFTRRGDDESTPMVIVCNFTPVPRHDYRIGLPAAGSWTEVMNSDATEYGGSGVGNLGAVVAREEPSHDLPHSVDLTLPPLAAIFLRADPGKPGD